MEVSGILACDEASILTFLSLQTQVCQLFRASFSISQISLYISGSYQKGNFLDQVTVVRYYIYLLCFLYLTTLSPFSCHV